MLRVVIVLTVVLLFCKSLNAQTFHITQITPQKTQPAKEVVREKTKTTTVASSGDACATCGSSTTRVKARRSLFSRRR